MLNYTAPSTVEELYAFWPKLPAPRVASTAILVPEAATALVGRKLDETALAGLDRATRRTCKPIDDKRGTIEYRTKVAGVLARRTATIAYERAERRR
jgi:carbon-monoxide dehydrogenase medium subunit